MSVTAIVAGECGFVTASPVEQPVEIPAWATTAEGQRKGDLGNGFYLNPIMAGDRPDPSVLKDGDDYYMTFSSFEAYPGLTIWHSKDLPAMRRPRAICRAPHA